MQRYSWPGYDMQLLGELQKQQNNAQFCDVLLKTDGISVPTHSCILAALSPYLCQKLSASPSPPSGQKRELWLQAVKAQTLLKLVRLLYSGEVEVIGIAEQNDLLSAACQFGILHLVEGQKNGQVGEGKPQKGFRSCRERNERRKMQDAQVQAKVAGWRNTVPPTEKRSCLSTGRRSVNADQRTVGCSTTHSVQTEHPTPEPEPSVAKNGDCSISLQSQSITLDTHVSSTPCPHISCVHSGAQSDAESAFNQSFGSVPNPTPTSSFSGNVMAFSFSNSTTPLEDRAYQQSSNLDSIHVFAKGGTGLKDRKTNGKTAVNGENTEHPSNRDEMLEEEKGNSTEIRHAHANVGIKSLTKMKRMQQMMETETAQISIKVKLRRRTNGEVWEVVSMQNTDESLSVLTSLDGSSHKRPQTDLTNSEPPPSCVQPGPTHKPETLTIQPATTNSPEPPHPNSPADSQLFSSDCLNNDLESVPLPQPPGPAEECDEQIEKLLEDFMMGLNILPNLDRDCTKSHYLQPNHEGAQAICQVPVTENERPLSRIDAAASTVGCEYYQDFGSQIGHASTDTAQNQPSCSSLSSVQPAAALVQQLQRSPQYHSSVTSVGQRDGTSHQGMPLSKTQMCPYPEAPTGQKLLTSLNYFPVCQGPPVQDNQNILELLPLFNGNGAQSLHSLPCMDDLRLPPCLSPLEPSTSPAKHYPTLNSSTIKSDDIQPQSPVHGFRPWLAVNSRPLQFPLSAITHVANTSASLPQDSNGSCGSKQRRKHRKLNPQSGGTRTASCSVTEVEERGAISAGHQKVAEQKSDLKKKKMSLKCKESETKGDAAVPKKRKRKRTDHPQEASSTLADKHVKVSDGTKKRLGQINLSVCLVSLSSNNVLAKEREMAAGSNMPNTLVGKTKERSTITESQGRKTGLPGDLNTNQTRIGTRGFLKRTLATPSSSSIESLISKPQVCRDQIVNKQDVPKRGRGRPRKTKVEEIPPESSLAVKDIGNPDVKKEVQLDSSVLQEESKKPKRCKKRIRNRSEVEAVPPMALSAEASHNSDASLAGTKVGAPKRPQMVNLQEFKKLIKRQHSKTRKSKESQDKKTSETAKDVECEEGKTCGSRFEELTNRTEMYIAQPQNGDGVKECPAIFNVTVDKNHNQIVKSAAEYDELQQEETSRSTSNETCFLGDGSPSGFSFDEEATLAAETEKPLKNPDEACDGVSDKPPQTEGSSPSDTHLPQEDKKPLLPNLNPQTPERTSPLLHAVEFGRRSDCDQEEEEEVEEDEVDVLLFSPDKMPLTEECENGLDNMETSPEEEEEEDVIEIDVTGD